MRKLNHKTFDALNAYFKLRWNHLDKADYKKRKELTIASLKKATPARREKFVQDIEVFLETNKEAVEALRRNKGLTGKKVAVI